MARCGIKDVLPISKNKMLIHQSKANLDEKILSGRIIHLQDLTIENRNNAYKVFEYERGIHLPFWTMIYLALKRKFNTIVSFRNRIQISIGRRSWKRIELLRGPLWKYGQLDPLMLSLPP